MIAKNDKDWHRIVCEEANYRCCVCGRDYSAEYYFNEQQINQYVCGHHVLTKKAFPELRLETNNGVCVCNQPSCANYNQGCHNAIHNGKIKLSNLQCIVLHSLKRLCIVLHSLVLTLVQGICYNNTIMYYLTKTKHMKTKIITSSARLIYKLLKFTIFFSLFCVLKTCEIIARVIYESCRFLTLSIEQSVFILRLLREKIQRPTELNIGDIAGFSEPAFSNEEKEEMSNEILKEYDEIPTIREISTYFDISDRQSKYIRDLSINKSEKDNFKIYMGNAVIHP